MIDINPCAGGRWYVPVAFDKVTTAAGTSNIASVALDITPVNDAPTAV